MNFTSLPGYDWRQSYDWNYENVPEPAPQEEPVVPGHWELCGVRLPSPLGIAAGPLLNGRWILYYAGLGFDVLTYKTVRSKPRVCYPLPNLQPVEAKKVDCSLNTVRAGKQMRGSWAVSFGMPSKPPEVWRADVESTRGALPKNKLLSVSVVATPEADWQIDDVAADFAQCAKWAVESGADCVEANFSCPNVASADGQLYQQPELAALVAARLREATGARPLLIKIGHVADRALATALTKALAPHAQGLVMVNCIATKVTDGPDNLLFGGQKRGIAGAAIRAAALDQVELFASIIDQQGFDLQIVGVGGIASAGHLRDYSRAGSRIVQLATAAMLDPVLAIRIRSELARREGE